MIEVFRQVDLFAELSDACLERLAASATEKVVPAGDWFVHEGETVDQFNVLTEGLVEWVRMIAGEEVVMASRGAVTYFGAMNLLTQEPAMAGGRAVVDCTVVVVPGDEFRSLLRDEPSVLRGALAVIAPVAQGAEAVLREREKLVALGTLSAGLAHELNNPAASAQRSASDLAEALEVIHRSVQSFVTAGVERADAAHLVALHREALERSTSADPSASMEEADREEVLIDLLEDRGLEGWRLAPPLAEAGLDEDWITRLEAHSGAAFAAAVEWVSASLTTRVLVRDLHDSTERISGIVAAVKDYTHMDQAQTQVVDIHDGIDSTLTMLAHKLKKGDVRLEREYDRDLPQITAHASQLNQVWTNLIDNAIDAVGGTGTIRVRTSRVGDEAMVEVIDDGPGVPPELQSRLFEPFFTTKDVGSGTGLGLDIVRRIVENHRGQVRLVSSPGDTRFQVRLPLPMG